MRSDQLPRRGTFCIPCATTKPNSIRCPRNALIVCVRGRTKRDGGHFIPQTWVTLSAFARRAKVPWQECNRMDERLKFRCAGSGWREDRGALPPVRHLPQDRCHKIISRYNACGLEGLTDPSRRPYRHANQASIPNREADCACQAGEAELGRTEDQGTTGAVLPGRANAGDLNRARGARPQRAGRAPQATAKQGTGNTILPTVSSERLVVRRLQG